MSPAEIKRFLLAGAALFTLDNGSGRHFTYKISKKEPQPGRRYTDPSYFVGVLDGPESFSYMGLLNPRRGTITPTKGSKVSGQALSAVAIGWALRLIWAGKSLPAPSKLLHAGKCGRCGRPLTDPISVQSGIGPDCAEQMGIDRGRLLDQAAARQPGEEG